MVHAALKVELSMMAGVLSAGENNTLTCSVTVVGSVTTPTFQWFHDNAKLTSGDTRTIADRGESSYPYSSILRFSPLQQFHQGNYTCIVSVDRVHSSKTTSYNVGGENLAFYVAACIY